MKRKNSPDLTLRNIRQANRRIGALERAVLTLQRRVQGLRLRRSNKPRVA